MAVAIIMPKQGNTVESCILSKLYVKQGDNVKPGDLLFNYETDKSAFDEECKDEGVVLKCFYEEGDDIECLKTVLVIGREGEDISQYEQQKDEKTVEAQPSAEQKAERVEAEVTSTALQKQEERIFISKRAKHLANKAHMDINLAEPTGPYGRIIERDIERLIRDGLPSTVRTENEPAKAAQGSASAFEDVKLTNIRKVIAKTMLQSTSQSAQLTMHEALDATAVMEFRKRLKASAESMQLPNITINDIVLFAVSRIIKKYPDFNAHFNGEYIRRFNDVNMGVAVDTERGLMVPTLAQADKKSIWQISSEAKALAKSAQAGTISPDLLAGGTFTVTNLGSLGVEYFTPVINPPQTAILGVGGLTWRTKPVNGTFVNYQAMTLSLTIDHRIIDGAPAAKFLRELCFALENFDVLLLKETI